MATKTSGKVGNEGQRAKYRGKGSPPGLAGKKESSPPRAGGKSKGKIDAPGGADPAYLTLIRRLPLRPIRTDAELDAAICVIDELTDRDDLSVAETDYLDVLGDLVEKYEDEHIDMPHVSDAAMLRSLMEEKGVRQADVVRSTGISKTVLSLVLNGKRDLTREHIGALSKYFGVNPGAFLGPA
ncbi:MAG: helix-turn-helix domain-containing protein [Isosphaeraceae bacterium]|jgi:HTH-type transcriptional regulator/antitoxin HigA